MKYIQIFLVIVLSIGVTLGFFHNHSQNYRKHLEIRDNFIKHPESLPTSLGAEATSFGFKNIKADWYWLNTIQYIGGNAVRSEYKKYLYNMLDLITDLNPYFQHPYIIGTLLLPSSNPQYESFSEEQIDIHIEQAEILGLKGIENFCESHKIEKIRAQDDLGQIWSDPQYANPCQSYDIPYGLGFVYYFYLNDPLEAAAYYKIASAHADAIDGAKVMAAVMQGKGGEREKAFFMFLSLSDYIAGDDPVCRGFSEQFGQLGAGVFSEQIPLTGRVIADIGYARDITLGLFGGEDDDIQIDDTSCISYINKAVREINLYYLEKADEIYRIDRGRASKHAGQLFDDGYIDFLPRDFQQYSDYEIIYEYNADTGKYDYGPGNYE